jgi:hypothetical protein
MGWRNLAGVLKYYAYYVSPAFFLILLFFLYFFVRDTAFIKYSKALFFSKEAATLFAAFLLFFSISEILPRLFNIAFLPERGWVFGGIFSIVFLFLLFKQQKSNKFLCVLVIISLFINLGGALYINNLKKYMITSGNIASAEWIKKNLPSNRIIFSNISQNAMGLYSSSIAVGVPSDFYYNQTIYQKNLDQLKPNKNKQNIYIYYSKISANNPYIGRPYYKLPDQPQDFIFDNYSDKFKRVYFDSTNDIIIWKIL